MRAPAGSSQNSKDIQDYMKAIESTRELLENEVAIRVDLEHDLVLVPKQWVKEYVWDKIGSYTYAIAVIVLTKVMAMKKKNVFLLVKSMEQAVSVIKAQAE